MKIYKDLKDLPIFQNAVLTIGSFDGVHIGHQQIIKQINDLAKSINGQSVLITFHPHPRLVLSKDAQNLKLLNTPNEKAILLEQYDVDVLVIVPFSKGFADQSPDEYIQDFLVKNFQPKIIAIGYDHKFGKDRVGNISYLKKFETAYNYKVVEISEQEIDNATVSSTKIREALQKGNISEAQKMLGHRFELTGKVAKGLQIGTQIGFPTANILIEDSYKLIPPEGIYAVWVYYNELKYKGMLYIGNRPTIDQNLAQTIEVNIFDFNLDIYGQELRVELVEYLREDAKFEGLEALQAQLEMDKVMALTVLEQ